MGTRDPRVDAYIARSADFAKPVLTSLRETVHAACPDVEETMKWSMPHFEYHGILCGMAAFKQHCTFGFWKASLILEDSGRSAGEAMGQFGRITSVSALPPKKVLTAYIRKAMQLNEQGVAAPSRSRQRRRAPRDVEVPKELSAALKKNPKALATFEAFSPSHRREYVAWIAEAKREETRQRRVEAAVAQLAEGKTRNWKYERRTGR